MSKINIQGIVDEIKGQFSVYAPLLEAIVNSIQAIDEAKITNGKIRVVFERANKINFNDEALPEIINVYVIDNGIGFIEANRDSFDTYRAATKKEIGGKGFGRFMYLKFFNSVRVESVYKNGTDGYSERKFNFGKQFNIIENEEVTTLTTLANENITKVSLLGIIKIDSLEKQLETIARKLFEHLLIFFVDPAYKCPEIWLEDGSNEGADGKLLLNDFLSRRKEIELIKSEPFTLKNGSKKEKFTAKVFKIFYTNKKSRITLVAQKRQVTETPIHNYIPEFVDDFFEITGEGDKQVRRNYIIKVYVIGEYLTSNASVERDSFDFPKEIADSLYPFSQKDIEAATANVVKTIFTEEVNVRSERKREQIMKHVNETAPWHKPYINDIDLSSFSFNAEPEKIETELQKYKFNEEVKTRKDVKEILEDTTLEYEKKLEQVLSKVTQIGKSDLAHYVSNRKVILDIFQKLLNRDQDGNAEYEKDIHKLIFPMNRDSTQVDYENHNLWLLDERLVFSDFVASDRKIGKKNSPTEPDLVIFDKKGAFRAGDNEFSNPITLYEFKRPKRENYNSDEDPIAQIGNYLEEIRAGKYETPGGVEKIKVNEYTPAYGYVICDLVAKIKEFAKINQLTLSPDGEGYFGFHTGYRMYIEVISFKKLLKDANLRNKIFFKKLQIE